MQSFRPLYHALTDLRRGYPVVLAGLAVHTSPMPGWRRIVPSVREAGVLNPRDLLVLALAKRAGVSPELWVEETRAPGVTQMDIEAFLAAPPVLVPVTSAPVALPVAACEDARILGFDDGTHTHVALLIGQPEQVHAPLCRLHSACLTGDVLGSLRCDCGTQLQDALQHMVAEGAGVLLYLQQEGRGIGLSHKLRAYLLQSQGMDTVEANEALGFEADERDFSIAGAMLSSLDIRRVRVLTNNRKKPEALGAAGIEVAAVVPLTTRENPHNQAYLSTKSTRMGHGSNDCEHPPGGRGNRPQT